MRKHLITFLCILLIVGIAFSARNYYEVIFPNDPSNDATRFWRSGTGTVTLSDKDSLITTAKFYSNVFPCSYGTEQDQYMGHDQKDQTNRQINPDEIWLFGTALISNQFQDSLMITWYGHRANGDSTTTAVAAQDTVVLDTVGVSDVGDKIYFEKEFSPAFFYDKMSIVLEHVRGVSGDTLFLNDCGVRMRWND